MLLALGFWQIHRLEYKKELLHLYKINPNKIISSEELQNFSELDLYKMITIKGHFIKHPIFYYAPEGSKIYYEVYQPFQDNFGRVMLVHRGKVNNKNIDNRKVATDQILAGNVIKLSNKSNIAVKNDYQKNCWFYLSDKELCKYYKIDNLLPVIIISQQANMLIGEPVDIKNKVSIRNDHLQYAVTWFSLAVVAIIFAIFSYKKKR